MALVSALTISILCTSFGLVFYQDLRYRSIHWSLIPFGLIAVVGYTFGLGERSDYLVTAAVNVLLLVVIIAGICLYTMIKEKEWQNPFDRLIGWGDILFLFVLCFGLSSVNFLLFITISSVLILLFALPVSLGRKDRMVRIPYAGLLAIFYLLAVLPDRLISGGLFMRTDSLYFFFS